MKSLIPHILLLFLLVVPAVAQIDTTANRRDTTSVPPPTGSAGSNDSLAVAPRPSPAPGEYVMTKNPLTATLLSIVPGGGQVYTEQYIKAPIFLGVATFFAVQAVRYHNLFSEQADIYDGLAPGSFQRDNTKQLREFYRDERDQNVAYFVGVQILSMIDAYVGAHLFDFDVDDEPSGSSKIYIDPWQQRVGLWLRF